MAQTVCYVFPDDAEWKIELGRQQVGSYAERQTAIEAAVEATRTAAIETDADGAEVRVAEGLNRWHTAWSIWSAKRSS
jgi:hypothetical protein